MLVGVTPPCNEVSSHCSSGSVLLVSNTVRSLAMVVGSWVCYYECLAASGVADIAHVAWSPMQCQRTMRTTAVPVVRAESRVDSFLRHRWHASN